MNKEKKIKENILETHKKMIETYWDYERNNKENLFPENFVKGSHQKVWWKCEECGKSFEREIRRICKKNNCYCKSCATSIGKKNHKKITKKNSLIIQYPELIKEWNYEGNKNEKLYIENMTIGSHTKCNWICSKGHKWKATVKDRTNGHGCPYCSGRKAITGKTDLKTKFPEIAKEWDYDKNYPYRPEEIPFGSGKEFYWICSKGHSFKSIVNKRTSGQSCPFCNTKNVKKLKNVCPELFNEIDKELNSNIDINNINIGSKEKIYWKCSKCGHKWRSTISNRLISDKNGNYIKKENCSKCHNKNKSFREMTIFFYIKQIFPDAISGYKDLGFELDIYIPSLKIGIEYDGYIWHKDKIDIDIKKNQKCLKNKIKLYRFREMLDSLKSTSIDFLLKDDRLDTLEITLKNFFLQEFNKLINIDIETDRIKILDTYKKIELKNSISITHPTISKEWHPTKNLNLLPTFFSYGSNQKVWWLGSCGHEWEDTIKHRTSGVGCPYCNGKKVLKGFNDFETKHPELLAFWDKNNSYLPSEVTEKSSKEINCTCKKCGYKWKTSVSVFSNSKGCPVCNQHKIIKGKNDILTKFPELFDGKFFIQWDYKKNQENNIYPEGLAKSLMKKVWWLENNISKYRNIRDITRRLENLKKKRAN